MVNVAIAGGSSPTLGKSIIQAIQTTGKQHSIIILSRAPSPTSSSSEPKPTPKTASGVPIHYIDYTSVESTTAVLLTNKIHTLISIVKPSPPSTQVPIHKTLLSASKSANVSRFIMSDWSMPSTCHGHVEMLTYKAELAALCDSENSSSDGVACSTIQVGMFMNYLAQGSPITITQHPNSQESEELLAGLDDEMLNDFIALPSRLLTPVGSDADRTPMKISMTHIHDIGRLLAASLALDPRLTRGSSLGMVSQTVDFAQVHRFLTRECGLQVPYETVTEEDCVKRADEYGVRFDEGMRGKGKFDLGAFLGRMVWQMLRVVCMDTAGVGGNGSQVPSFNKILEENGLGVDTWKVEDLLRKAWGRREVN